MTAGLLKWAFRPGVLIAASIVLVGAAALVVYQSESKQGKPQPLAVESGEQEVAFLYQATSNSAWERFVAAVDRAATNLQTSYPGLEVVRNAMQDGASIQTVAEVALRFPVQNASKRRAQRLVFRWYKLTSEWSPQVWIDALLARTPPPVAIIGGNNSYWGRELALQLSRAAGALPESDRPLLLLTTATADHVPVATDDSEEEGKKVELAAIHPGRTFRFCFTNRQMATAVTRFIWTRPELRPDSDPAYLVRWMDDAYSEDLFDGYKRVLDHRALDNLMQQWGFVSGCIGLGLHPAGLAGWFTSSFRHEYAVPYGIDSSVGSFAAPNPYEARDVHFLLRSLLRGATTHTGGFPGPKLKSASEAQPARNKNGPHRPLLVITGQAQPSRRFLRELARSAPHTARRFVVAMGDAMSFNTIYRDRLVAWPIQDFPFEVVFFCHRNPIDRAAGFIPLQLNPGEAGTPSTGTDEAKPAEPIASVHATSGTEDLLLFRDIVEALALAFGQQGGSVDAANLAQGLLKVKLLDNKLTLQARGKPFFRPDGQRSAATGENVVYLRPRFQGDRVLPEAVIEVWSRQSSEEMISLWKQDGKPLTVSYDEYEVYGDRPHGGD
jgi:hypothetical protein